MKPYCTAIEKNASLCLESSTRYDARMDGRDQALNFEPSTGVFGKPVAFRFEYLFLVGR